MQVKVEQEGLKLHVGCGMTKVEKFLNCDLHEVSGITDVVFDLTEPWPFESNSTSSVLAYHVLEHLPIEGAKNFFRYAWDVMQEDAQMDLRVPYGGHPLAMCDVGHHRPWYPGSFLFLQPGYAKSILNPEHLQWNCPFVIDQMIVRMNSCIKPWVRWRWMTRRIMWLLEVIPGLAEEIIVHLRPLKTRESIQKYIDEDWASFTKQTFAYMMWTKNGQTALQPILSTHLVAAYVNVKPK